MNSKFRRLSAAALTLVLCLAISPITAAKAARDRRDRFERVDPIVRIVNRIKQFFGRISSLDDFPGPPNP